MQVHSHKCLFQVDSLTSLPHRGRPNMRRAHVERRDREKLHYVHSASLAYEDGSVFMSGPFAEWL